MKRALERIALAAASLSLLAGLEVGLRVLGYGVSGALDFGPRFDVLYAPDPSDPAQMVMAPWLRSQAARGRKMMNPDRFPRHRPPGELRIIAVGESAVFGWPHGGPVAFPYQLGDLLRQRHPGLPVRVINAGTPGFHARQVLHVVREMVAYEPSALLVYSGHNEYLFRFALDHLDRLGFGMRLRRRLLDLRVYQLMTRLLAPILRARGDPLLDVTHQVRAMKRDEAYATPRSERETRLVEQRYLSSLALIVDESRRAGVPLVLCTVVSQLQSYPKHSTFGPDLSPAAQVEAERLAAELPAWDRDGRWEALEPWSRAAIALAPRYAPFHYYLGRALLGQNRLEEARVAFERARELESTPRRASAAFNDAIRESADGDRVVMVDLEAEFLSDMDHGCWGSQLFLDDLHPEALGHRIIARMLLDEVPWESFGREGRQ